VTARIPLRTVALGYLAALLVIPVGFILYKAFEKGLAPVIDSLTTPQAEHAFYLTFIVVAIAVPLNTIFGIATSLLLVRTKLPGRRVIDALIDLPFAVSPVVIGLSLVLVYGNDGFLGGPLADAGIKIIFSTPGIILATVFVSLPFVVREVSPVLREIGTEQEDAAGTLGASPWQTFRRVTLPAIRPAVAYGVVLTTARALGEYGAVSVVSGKFSGRTETATLLVENQFQGFNLTGAYAAAIVLALMAVAVLVGMNLLDRNRRLRHGD
jgi:sulfate/thiosulfate transport system permease protein